MANINVSRKSKITILSIIGILIIALSLTYAYMAPHIGKAATTKVDIVSGSLDKMDFEQGTPIGLTVDSSTLGMGKGNLTGSTTSSVTLVANNTTNEATKYYDVVFDIEENGFFYTTLEKTPEIILTIKDQNNNNVTSVPGLTYVNQGGVSGFDITEYEGEIVLKSKQEITTTSSTTGTTHTWNATITFINLDVKDQSDIEGKTMSANLIIEENNITNTILRNNGGKSHIEGKSSPDFNTFTTINEGMFVMDDDHGMSYYFRGAVDNNWIKFGKENGNYIYWRIVRINGNGSVKLIYSGTTPPTELQKVVMTGSGTESGQSAFSTLYSSAEYVGYMYTLGTHRGHGTSSTIKTNLDTWYINNLLSYEKYLSDFVVCNDREFDDDWIPVGFPSKTMYSKPLRRTWSTAIKQPKLTCTHKEDRYTVKDTVIGNGKLTYPIGLLTADEVVLAGAIDSITDSKSHYLYTNRRYVLVSPFVIGVDYVRVCVIGSSGNITGYIVQDSSYGVRPVISLSSDITVSGTGQWNDPYIVDM